MSDIAEAQGLDIGRVIQETFAVVRRQISTFLLLAIILVGAPTAVFQVLAASMAGSMAGGMVSRFSLSGPQVTWGILGFLVTVTTSTILQATVIYGAASDLNGRPFSLTDSLRAGLRAFLPLIGLGILLGIAVFVGMCVFIVPGVLMALAWCVAVPVYVVEQPGVFGAFGRSADLTRNNRLRILALAVLWIVGVIILSIILGVVGGILGAVSFGLFRIVQEVIVQPAISVVSALFGATLSAVLYVELRRVREGAGPQALAAMFD